MLGGLAVVRRNPIWLFFWAIYYFGGALWYFSNVPWYVHGYLILINVAAFAAFNIDKRRALKDEWRIPEARLHLLTVAGGVIGSSAGMAFRRHKIRKPIFYGMLFVGFGVMITIVASTARWHTPEVEASAPQQTDQTKPKGRMPRKHSGQTVHQ